jgi:hypothetical protein
MDHTCGPVTLPFKYETLYMIFVLVVASHFSNPLTTLLVCATSTVNVAAFSSSLKGFVGFEVGRSRWTITCCYEPCALIYALALCRNHILNVFLGGPSLSPAPMDPICDSARQARNCFR